MMNAEPKRSKLTHLLAADELAERLRVKPSWIISVQIIHWSGPRKR